MEWGEYYDRIAGRAVRPLLGRALAAYGAVAAGARALDVGAGDGTETPAMLAAGFHVTTIDSSAESARLLRALGSPRLTVVESRMEAATWPPADLVYSGFTLSFCSPDAFERVWASLREALRPGGLIACNVFGDRDSWAGQPGMTFLTREHAEGLLDGVEVVDFREDDADGEAANGPKHWHVFEFLARQVSDH